MKLNLLYKKKSRYRLRFFDLLGLIGMPFFLLGFILQEWWASLFEKLTFQRSVWVTLDYRPSFERRRVIDLSFDEDSKAHLDVRTYYTRWERQAMSIQDEGIAERWSIVLPERQSRMMHCRAVSIKVPLIPDHGAFVTIADGDYITLTVNNESATVTLDFHDWPPNWRSLGRLTTPMFNLSQRSATPAEV
jgi:hypothetical protein